MENEPGNVQRLSAHACPACYSLMLAENIRTYGAGVGDGLADEAGTFARQFAKSAASFVVR